MTLSLLHLFGDSSSGIGALGINGQGFIIQLITFILVFLVLRKWAFKPILRVLQQRRELIESGVKLGTEMQKEKAELEKQVSEELHKARTKADEMITASQQAARALAAEAEDNARAKAKLILDEADERIDQETTRARKRLEKELVGLVSDATEAIIGEKVDAKKDAELIDRALKGRAS